MEPERLAQIERQVREAMVSLHQRAVEAGLGLDSPFSVGLIASTAKLDDSETRQALESLGRRRQALRANGRGLDSRWALTRPPVLRRPR